MGIRRTAGTDKAGRKEIRRLAEVTTARGWSVETLGSGHIRFTKAGRKPLVTGPPRRIGARSRTLRAGCERKQAGGSGGWVLLLTCAETSHLR